MANQYKVDPRQSMFLQAYLDPQSETFSNAYQSAINAGYSEEYAQNITSLMPDWLSDSIADLYIAKEAQSNIMKAVTGEAEDIVKAFGKNVKWEATTLAAKGLMKGKYSERIENTGKDGQPLMVTFDSSLKGE
jgi:phage terminase small subunit